MFGDDRGDEVWDAVWSRDLTWALLSVVFDNMGEIADWHAAEVGVPTWVVRAVIDRERAALELPAVVWGEEEV